MSTPTTLVDYENSDTVPVGKVTRTDPPAGQPAGDTITVWISLGPVGGTGIGFPAVSQFGGLLQGASG